MPSGDTVAVSLCEPVLLLTISTGTTSAAESGTGDPVILPRDTKGVVFQLDVTSASNSSGDKLSAYVQTSLDDTNWINIVAFTPVTGAATKRYVAKVVTGGALTEFETATALAQPSSRNFLGRYVRGYYKATPGSGNMLFTGTIRAVPL